MATTLEVISQLRHFIVHRRGRVNAVRIWKNFGFNVVPSARPDDMADRGKLMAFDLLKEHVRPVGEAFEVWLIVQPDAMPLDALTARPLKRLLDVLNTHAVAMYTAVLRDFRGTPLWKRESGDASPSHGGER